MTAGRKGRHPGVQVRLPGQPGIERRQSLGGLHKQNRRLRPGIRCVQDLSPEAFGAGELHIVNGQGLGLG